MILDFLIVADAAIAEHGKLYIHGGGVTRIMPPVMPWHQPLAFCARFIMEDGDDPMDERHFSLITQDPAGTATEVVRNAPLPQLPASTWLEGEERGLAITVTTPSLVFRIGGTHRVELLLDDLVVRTVPIIVLSQ